MDTPVGIALTSFLVGLSGAMMPGPVLTVTIGETAVRLRTAASLPDRTRILRGALAGPLIVLGHGLLEIVLVVAVAMGLGAFLVEPLVLGLIGTLGGAVLIWMALGMFRGVPELSLRAAADRGGPSRRHPVLAGILTSLANPYWMIWWATIGLGYIAMSMRLGSLGLTAFYAGHILSDLAWYSGVSLSLALGHRMLSDVLYRSLVAVCASFLLGFGLYFGYLGLNGLWV